MNIRSIYRKYFIWCCPSKKKNILGQMILQIIKIDQFFMNSLIFSLELLQKCVFGDEKIVRIISINRFLQLNPNQLSWNFSPWQSKWHLITFCVRQVDIFHTFGFRGNSNLAAEKSIFSNRFALFALKVSNVKTKKKFNLSETANDLLDLLLCVDKIP